MILHFFCHSRPAALFLFQPPAEFQFQLVIKFLRVNSFSGNAFDFSNVHEKFLLELFKETFVSHVFSQNVPLRNWNVTFNINKRLLIL